MGIKISRVNLSDVTGIDRRSGIHHMEQNKLYEARNGWQPDPGSHISRRPGTKAIVSGGTGQDPTPSDIDFITQIINLSSWSDRVRGRTLAGVAEFGTGTYDIWDTTTPIVIDRNLSTTLVPLTSAGLNVGPNYGADNRGFFLPWMGRVYFFPGPGASYPFIWIEGITDSLATTYGLTYPYISGDPRAQRYVDPITGEVISGVGDFGTLADQLRPRWAAVYNTGQFVLAGMDYPYNNSIIFCGVSTEAGIHAPTLSDAMVGADYGVGPDNSDSVTAVFTQSIRGGANIVETPLLIFKKNSLWIGKGRPAATDAEIGTSKITFGVEKIGERMGTSAPRTIVETPFGVIWANEESVWLWDGSPQPKRIGDHISPLLQECAGSSSEWHAEYIGNETGGIYQLSMSLQDNAIDVNWAAGTTVLTSPEKQCRIQYWLDMRRGLDPAATKWWGPMEFPSMALHYVKNGFGDQGTLLGLYGATAAGGTAHSRIVEYNQENSTGQDDHIVLANNFDPSFHDPVMVTLKTGYNNLGDPMLNKTVDAIDVNYSCPYAVTNKANFTIRTIGSGGARVSSDLVTAPAPTGDATVRFVGLATTPTSGLDPPVTTLLPDRLAQVHVSTSVHPRADVGASSTRFLCNMVGIEIVQNKDSNPSVGDSITANRTAKTIEFAELAVRYIEIPRRPT